VGGRKSKDFAYTELHHLPQTYPFLPGGNVESSHFFMKYWGGWASNPLLPRRLIPEQPRESHSLILGVNRQAGVSVSPSSGAKQYSAVHLLPEKHCATCGSRPNTGWSTPGDMA